MIIDRSTLDHCIEVIVWQRLVVEHEPADGALLNGNHMHIALSICVNAVQNSIEGVIFECAFDSGDRVVFIEPNRLFNHLELEVALAWECQASPINRYFA